MADDQPGPPGGGSQDERPGERPTEPLGGPPQPPQPPPSHAQPGGDQPSPPAYGPPQPTAQPYGYGQPGYGYPPAPQTEGLATAALVTAIVGFFVCLPVGAIVALVLAHNAEQRIEAAAGRLSGREQARAARIIAIIELVLFAIFVLAGVIVGVIAFSQRNVAVGG